MPRRGIDITPDGKARAGCILIAGGVIAPFLMLAWAGIAYGRPAWVIVALMGIAAVLLSAWALMSAGEKGAQ